MQLSTLTPARQRNDRPAGRYDVLIVDSSEDNREVLRTVLGCKGIGTLDTDRPEIGLEWAREHRPCVVVLDSDCDDSPNRAVLQRYASAVQAAQSRLLWLGDAGPQPIGGTQRMSKPYHYGPLIRRIEELISQTSGSCDSDVVPSNTST